MRAFNQSDHFYHLIEQLLHHQQTKLGKKLSDFEATEFPTTAEIEEPIKKKNLLKPNNRNKSLCD